MYFCQWDLILAYWSLTAHVIFVEKSYIVFSNIFKYFQQCSSISPIQKNRNSDTNVLKDTQKSNAIQVRGNDWISVSSIVQFLRNFFPTTCDRDMYNIKIEKLYHAFRRSCQYLFTVLLRWKGKLWGWRKIDLFRWKGKLWGWRTIDLFRWTASSF